MPAADPAERSAVATLAITTRWAKTTDRDARAATLAPARAGRWARFLREADPDGVLDPTEREQRAEALRREHYAEMARAKARKARLERAEREEREAAERAAEAQLKAQHAREALTKAQKARRERDTAA